MSEVRHTKKLFLSGQRLFRLKGNVPEHHRRFHVCGDGPPPTGEIDKEPWDREDRADLVKSALSPELCQRVALVCDAGLGKTTNMEWLQKELSQRGSRQVPLLLRLDAGNDLKSLVEEHAKPDTLLHNLAIEVARKLGGNVHRLLQTLSRYRDQGRITLLIDGLDHALSLGNIPEIVSQLLKSRWQPCPVWISGRPYAFGRAWELFESHAEPWQFLRVEPLRQRDIERYLTVQVEPDEATRSGVNWYEAVPDEGRDLLAIPRFLDLMAGIFEREVSHAKTHGRDPRQAVEGLDLRTQADVYYLAYFEPGTYVAPQDRLTDKRELLNKRGLIAQALDVRLNLPDEKFKYIGLKEGVVPDKFSYREQIQFVGALLGAIAFEMYANPDKHRPKAPGGSKDQAKLEPNTSGIPQDKMPGFRDAVEQRLRAAGQPPRTIIDHEFSLLGEMNSGTVDFLLFRDLNEEGLVWHDRTVQAFFAAYWAMKFAAPEENRQLLPRWVVDAEGEELSGFNEFWTFAASLPDGLVDRDNWLAVFEPCYAPPQQVKGHDAWVQWHRRVIYHSFTRMKTRSPDTIGRWRESFFALPKGTAKQKRIYQELCGEDMFKQIPEGICPYGADPDEGVKGTARQVGASRLHQWQVTNEMYEEFDPEHRSLRWYGKHPLAKKRGRNPEDRCPVVEVTWYDAWCFAAWCGCRLPTELEWEHACRAESAERWWFGTKEAELEKHAWYDANSKESTHPVGLLKANPNNLYDMRGNVWEWCVDRWEPGASARVLRGGSWYRNGGSCRSAYRSRGAPDDRYQRYGFRLAAVPSLEPGQAGE